MKPSRYLATQPTFSWTNLGSATASTISHKFWRSAQAWAQPLVTWARPQTDDSAFFLQLQQEESYQRHLNWRREVNQQLRSCFNEIVTLYRQGALVTPEQLREALKAQQASFNSKSVSPWLYDCYIKRWAQRLPGYAHTLEGAAAQFREHLKSQPEEALGYFYHEVINHLIDRSGEGILPEITPSTALARAPLMAYYQGLVAKELWQAVDSLFKTNFGSADSSALIAVSEQHYQQVFAQLNALFLPHLAPGEPTDQLASTSPTSLLTRFNEALTAGWHYGQSHPKTALWGAAATALGASAAYLGAQPNSTRTSLSWFDNLQPIDVWLPYASIMAPLSLAMSVVSLSYAQQHPGQASWKTSIPLVLGVLIPLSPVAAQPQPERWVKTLGGTGSENGNSVQQTTDGGYIVTGSTTSFGAGGDDLLLSKWTAVGEVSWTRTLGGTGEDYGRSVQQTTDGGYIVTGSTQSFGAGEYDLWLSKWTASGDLSWTRTLGGTGSEDGFSVQQTTDGGYIVFGSTTSFGAGSWDLWLSKWTASGGLSWSKTLGGTGIEDGRSVQQTMDGGYIVTGSTMSFGAGLGDVWLSKWTASGGLSWSKTLGGTGNDLGLSVQQTTDGGYIVTGFTSSFGAGSADLWLCKWTASGGLSWSKTLGGTGIEDGRSVQQTMDGGYIVTGYTNSFGAGSNDLWFSKWTALGDVSWTRTLGGTGNDAGNSVQQTMDSGYIVIGFTDSFGAGSTDLWLSKWNSLGETASNQCVSSPNLTSVAAGLSAQTPTFTPGTPSVSAQNVVVSAQVANPVVGTSCNEPPVLSNDGGSFIYTENDPATVIDSTIILSDPDNTVLPHARVLISNGFASIEDVLGFTNQNGIVSSYQAETGVLTLSGVSSVANYQIALRRVTYRNTSNSPSTAIRTFQFIASDGQLNSNPITRSASIIPVNTAPALSNNGGSFIYTENERQTVIDNTITVSDPDSTFLVSAYVTISSEFNSEEDMLGFVEQDGITGHYNNTIGALALRGSSSVANYQSALRRVTYENTAEAPFTGERTFNFSVNDGELDSNPVTRSASINVNVAPIESSTENSDMVVLLAAIGAGAGSLLLCLSAVSYYFWRKRQHRPTHSLDRSLEMVSPDRLEKGYTIISDRFALINKITPEKAQLLQQQTGIEVTFAQGKRKQKFALGQGRFGKLRLAQDITTQEFVGVKKIKGEAQIAASEDEADILAQVGGIANIIQLKASVRTLGSDHQPVQYQFLELAGFGSGERLQNCLAALKDPALKRKLLVHIARGLLTGFSQLHEQKATVHLDMKPANFVLTQAGEVKIIDFGCARLLPEGTAFIRGGNGDMGYFSPDRIAHCRFLVGQHPGETLSHFDAKQADSWALGVTLFELATNRKLFPLIGAAQIMASRDTAYVIEQLALVSELYRPAVDSFWAMVKGLLDPHPKTRLTMQAALANPVFRDPAYQFSSPASQQDLFTQLKTLETVEEQETSAQAQVVPSAVLKDQLYAAAYLARQGAPLEKTSTYQSMALGASSKVPKAAFFQPAQGNDATHRAEEHVALGEDRENTYATEDNSLRQSLSP
jgi:serine/threonine protein kinase